MTINLCECGCGRPTTINKKSYKKRGIVKGEPRRYIQGHFPAHKHRTVETFAKIGASHRGMFASPQARKNMSLAHLGVPLVRKNYRPSDETRAKISASLKGRKLDPESRRKRAEARAGQPVPEAFVRALRDPAVQEKRLAALRAYFADRPKKVKPLKKPRSKTQEKPKRTMAQAKRDWWAALSATGRARLAEARSDGQKRRWAAKTREQKRADTASARVAISAIQKATWAELNADQRRDKMRPVYMAAMKANPSSIELTVRLLLDSIGVAYTPHAPIGRFTVDILIPERNLVIECDGSYWHGLPGCAEKDARRDAWLKSRGYNVLRLPEADIKAGAVTDRLLLAVS